MKIERYKRARLWAFGLVYLFGLMIVAVAVTADEDDTYTSRSMRKGSRTIHMSSTYFAGVIVAVVGGAGFLINLPKGAENKPRR